MYDQASLIALPPEMRERYVRHLNHVLPPRIQGLLVTLVYDQAMRPGPPFSVSEAEVRMLYEPAYDLEMLYNRDALTEGSHFCKLRLPWLQERGYLLSRR
jgi:thiopurine S-methyltransferase